MQPERWPHHLDTLMAKSADRGGESLAQHTWDVLEKLAALYRLRPQLSTLGQPGPSLWHCLFWTCLLHDFGKAARGFQAMLAGGDPWKHRHEVLSLAFFDWIAGALSEDEQRAVVAAIVSHHRDASVIQSLYPRLTPDPLEPLLEEIDAPTASGLWHWVDECADDWIETLGFAPGSVRRLPLLPHDEAVDLVARQGVRRVRWWLRRYERWVDELQIAPHGSELSVAPILLRGLTTTADHMASAHLGTMPAPLQESWESLAQRILSPGQDCYEHQSGSAHTNGRSALLIAPTGSGKTEAALYWALGDGNAPVPRLFYTLPYQASMNAMYLRLQHPRKGFRPEAIGLQHGRAVQALYNRLVDQESAYESAATNRTPHATTGTVTRSSDADQKSTRDAAARLARWEKNINTLNARPVKVFSPYQLLKAAFQLRGFEGMLADYAQAVFVFDEIHAYEPGRLALILAMMRYLREHFAARFFVMSATFPELIRSRLMQTLDLTEKEVIRANQKVFEKFQRHRLQLLSGNLIKEGISRILSDVRAGKTVLVCANSVRRAQAIRRALLQQGLPPERLLLIHSRFILKHRVEREGDIFKRYGVGVKAQPGVLIATQVVEVSLNIDLDTIYSDPAPLEALLQRFGRVNRAGEKPICPVYVFRQPYHGQGIYGDRLVQVTLAELERHKGEVIDEAHINDWLDRIYNDAQIRQEWEEAFTRMELGARFILDQVRPFESNAQSEQAFEEMFDNVEVVPARYAEDYRRCLENDDFLEASLYLLGISKKQYRRLERKGLVSPLLEPDGKTRTWVVRVPYHEGTGLALEQEEDDEGS